MKITKRTTVMEEKDVVLQQTGDTDSDGDCHSSSDGDHDLEEKESDSDDSSGDDIASLFHTTRFGRTATTWKKQFFQYFFWNIQYCIQIEIKVFGIYKSIAYI